MPRFYSQLILLVIPMNLVAQQDEQMSFYQHTQTTFNPSCAGMKGRMNCYVLSRFQWNNFQGAPNTQWFNIHAPIMKRRMGIGANFIHDQIGMRGRTGVNVMIAGRIKVNEFEQLRLGLSLGLDQYHIDFSEAPINDPNDALAVQQFSSSRMNSGLGIYYIGKKLNVGFSIPRIFPLKTMNNDVHVFLSSPHYYLMATRDFEINKDLQWKQSFLLKYVRNVPITIDLNSTLLVNDRIHLGFLYRVHEAIGISGLLKIKEQISVGYHYDFPVNGLLTFQRGTHEFMLKVELHDKITDVSAPKF